MLILASTLALTDTVNNALKLGFLQNVSRYGYGWKRGSLEIEIV